MTKEPMDDSNWREDYKGYKHLNKKQRELLENGPKSLSQSWLLGAMYQEWKRMRGYKEPDTCLLYTSPSPRDRQKSRMPSSA